MVVVAIDLTKCTFFPSFRLTPRVPQQHEQQLQMKFTPSGFGVSVLIYAIGISPALCATSSILRASSADTSRGVPLCMFISAVSLSIKQTSTGAPQCFRLTRHTQSFTDNLVTVRVFWEKVSSVNEEIRVKTGYKRNLSESEFLYKALIAYMDEHPEVQTSAAEYLPP